MSATRDATIAARVPHDLREDLEKIATRDSVDLSIVVRRILREGTDRELNGEVTTLDGIFAGGRRQRPSSATEVEARLKAAPRAGTGRFKALAEFELAAARGLTADDVVVRLAPAPHNGTAKRVSELAAGGLIRPMTIGPPPGHWGMGPHVHGATGGPRTLVDGEKVMDDGHVARPTRAGAYANVYVITAAGHRALEDARVKARETAA